MKRIRLVTNVVINAIREFGCIGGTRIIFQIVFRRLGGGRLYENLGGGVCKIYSRSLEKDIYYRPHSTDLNLIITFFLRSGEREYQINFDKGNEDVTAIVDCGANVGLFSMIYAVKYPNAKIMALEAEANNFEILKRNASQFDNIFPELLGVWFRDAYLKVMPRDSGEWGFTVKECSEDEKDIIGLSLDMILDKYSLKKLDILKMDIEGSEYEVITQNSDKWLMKTKILILETHERIRPGSEKLIEKVLKEHNFIEGRKNGENRIFYGNH